jgi:cobalt-zinc-cadmium efflux system outer membrane protein
MALAQAQGPVDLGAALQRAREVSPARRAALADVQAARAAERQAGAFPNPTLSGDVEHTTGDGDRNVVTTFRLAQPLDIWGARSARREVVALQREAAETALSAVEADLDLAVVQAWTSAVASAERAVRGSRVLAAFDTAIRISARRLAEGDLSGYDHRRLQLEAARYAGWQMQVHRDAEAARRALVLLIDSLPRAAVLVPDSLAIAPTAIDSTRFATPAIRADVRAAGLLAASAAQAATTVAKERIPVPTVVGGYKREQMPGDPDAWQGFVAGLAIPLPLWDRRAAAVDAATAAGEAARWRATRAEREVAHDLAVALQDARTVEAQSELLRQRLGTDARMALESLQLAWREGEISLLEWLDGVRAWHEAFDAYTTLQSERLVRRAILARAAGLPVADLLNEVP